MIQQVRQYADDAEAGDYLGWSSALTGDTVLAGEVQPMILQAKQNADDAEAGDYLGWSSALTGDTVLAGALFEDPDLARPK